MGFTGAQMLHKFDIFILALYLLSHGCALLKYTCKPKERTNNWAIRMQACSWTVGKQSFAKSSLNGGECTERTIVCLNSWKFYSSPKQYHVSAACDACDKKHVYPTRRGNVLRHGLKMALVEEIQKRRTWFWLFIWTVQHELEQTCD